MQDVIPEKVSDISQLAGKRIFHGVCDIHEEVLISLDGRIFKFTEDPDDGYRSYCYFAEEIFPMEGQNIRFNLDHTPLEVDVFETAKRDDFQGINIYGSDTFCKLKEHMIYSVGTDYSNDWYPYGVNSFDSIEATKVYNKQCDHFDNIILR